MNSRGVVGIAIAILLSAVLAGCGHQGNGGSSKSARAGGPPPAVPVGVATVRQRDFPVYLTGLGSVQAFNTVSLKSRVDGQIMQVNFREGQDVRKGDLLIVIDERPFQVALAQAQANLQRDEAQLANAKAQYERNKALYEGGVVAKQDLDTMQASFGQYEGTIAADKAAVDNAKLNLTYCRITSPIDGVAGQAMVQVGNLVSAAGGPITTVSTLEPVKAEFTVSEQEYLSFMRRTSNDLRRLQLKLERVKICARNMALVFEDEFTCCRLAD